MIFAYEQGLVDSPPGEHLLREISIAILDMQALKKELDGDTPSLASLMRLFEQPSEALRKRLEDRLLTRERRPYHLPQDDDDCDPGYFELERVITELNWRQGDILQNAKFDVSRDAQEIDRQAEQLARQAEYIRSLTEQLARQAEQTARQAAHIAALERQTARQAEHIAALQRQSAAKDAIILQQGCTEIPP
jgi:methyl-accepting chemotaxis protein